MDPPQASSAAILVILSAAKATLRHVAMMMMGISRMLVNSPEDFPVGSVGGC